MNRSSVHLLDLPDEILLMIMKRMSNTHVLYSLLNVNGRLDALAQDNIFTNTLTFVSVDDVVLINRFSCDILPRVGHRVKCLVLDPVSMQRILLAADYPELTALQICGFQQHGAASHFTEESPLRSVFQQRITNLILVNTDQTGNKDLSESYTMNVYSRVLNFFSNLRSLSVVDGSFTSYPALSLCDLPPTVFTSSNLTHLAINVRMFDDCLCLLDGRLNQLITLSVVVQCIDGLVSRVHSNSSLSQLKCVSFKSFARCKQHEKVILLLRRMVNLNRLTLYLSVSCQNRVLDGTYVQHDILDYLPQLESFTFYIGTYADTIGLTSRLRSDVLQQTLAKMRSDAAAIVNHVVPDYAACSIFSLPFQFHYLAHLGNKFPDIIFRYVTVLLIDDFDPFKHEFFVRMVRSFPSLKYLSVDNVQSPFWDDRLPFLPRSNQPCSVIEYPHLMSLDLRLAHKDYIDLFLSETKAHMPCLAELGIIDWNLKNQTRNFTREETRRNCAKIKRLVTWEPLDHSRELRFYFPSLEVETCSR